MIAASASAPQRVMHDVSSRHSRSRELALVAIIGAFFCAGLVPLAHDYYFAHVDEHLYADGAIRMVQSGNWTVAYDSGGYPRFQKPMLTYWLVAAAFRLFGISALSSRLPSLVAGAVTLMISYSLALRVTRRPDAGLLAVLILASTPIFILAAIRSNPDIFLTMFIALSAYGFAGLMFSESPPDRSGWYAYLGAGLAIMTKGMPALIFLGYVWLFASTGLQGRCSRVFPVTPLVVGVAFPMLWFLAMFHGYGPVFAHVMWNDQVRARISFGVKLTPLRIVAMVAQYLLFFLPWFVVLLVDWLSSRSRTDSAGNDGFVRFVAGFAMLYAVAFGLNPTMNGHYLLPACPLIAIALASALADCSSAAARVAINWIAVIVLAGLGLVSIATMVQPGRDAESIVVGLGCAAFAGLAMVSLRGLAQTRRLALVAIASYLFFPLSSILLRPWLLPDFGRQVNAVSVSSGAGRVRQIAFEGSEVLASQIRVQSGGTVGVVVDGANQSVADGREVIVAPATDAAELESHGYSIEPAGDAIARVPAIEVIRAVARLDLGRFLESIKQKYVMAFRAGVARKIDS